MAGMMGRRPSSAPPATPRPVTGPLRHDPAPVPVHPARVRGSDELDDALPPPGDLSVGSSGGFVRIYEQRKKDLHFDPGPLDGVVGADLP